VVLIRSEFVVVGAGVMGAAAAQWLAARGATVVLIDQYARGHALGGSHGDSRIFRLAYPDRDYTELAAQSLAQWRDLEEISGRELLVTTGGVDHGPGVVNAIGSVLAPLGVPFEVVPAPVAMDRWPGMRFEGDVVCQPDAGRLQADNAVDVFQTLAQDRGATLLFGGRATVSHVGEKSVVISTDADEIEAGVVILAAGPWVPGLVSSDVELPQLRVTHEEPAYFPSRQPSDHWPVFVHYATADNRFAGYGLAVPGRGVKVGLHASGDVIDPDTASRPSSPRVAARLAEYVGAWLPGLEPVPTETVSCLYDTTPREDFVIDRRGRVVVATGFSGHGFKFAPAIGQLVGQLARGEAGGWPRFGFRSG
jgi:sarcosine oxidase